MATIEGKPPRKVKLAAIVEIITNSRNSPIFRGFFFDSGGARGYYARPMSDRLPVQIDPIRLAQQGRSFVGRIPLSRLDRLVGMLVSDQGEIEVSLDFYKDARGRHCLNGGLRGELKLECQRCLQAMSLPIDNRFELVLVESEAEADCLAEEDEIFIVESTPILLTDMIEDELMLSLPQVAMHEEADCEVTLSTEEETQFEEVEQQGDEKPNPFAVLTELKRNED